MITQKHLNTVTHNVQIWGLDYETNQAQKGGKTCTVLTGLNAMQSSSHLTVRSTEVLFLFSDTHAGTSSAKVAHMLGLMEEISSMYSTGLI